MVLNLSLLDTLLLPLKLPLLAQLAGLVQDIKTVGTLKRIYLSDVVGTFSPRDGVKSIEGYLAAISSTKDLGSR